MKGQGSERERALLVGCSVKSTSKNPNAQEWVVKPKESLDELAFLASSAGAQVVGRLFQEREQVDPAFFIGRGKMEELQEKQRQFEADLVVFDENLSPAQLRNIEKRVDCRVIDRTQLILDIFAHRAHTREGKLQ